MSGIESYEAVLDDFRRWLDETHRAAADAAKSPDEPFPGAAPDGDGPFSPEDAAGEPVGLGDLVEAFTALRHELKLQTKSARLLQEQAVAASEAMEAALAALGERRGEGTSSTETALRPLVESLADLDEALGRGARAIETARRNLAGALDQRLASILEEEFQRLPRWRRWAAQPWRQRAVAACQRHLAQAEAGAFDALAEGFALVRARLDRAMRQHHLERIPCVGRQVDPHVMTVIGAVDDPHRPPGEVVEEVRPGYRWMGNVLRFAEVVAVRQRP